MIRAIMFDFDGLIVDTDTPEFRSWQEVFDQHGTTLELATWARLIGTSDAPWDPYSGLEKATGSGIDRNAIRAVRRARFAELMLAERVRPGVESYLREAKAFGLRIGLASSSPRGWVEGYLARYGLAEWFDVVRVAEDVTRTKPDPEVYRSALAGLGVLATEALALEDSPNGVAAAKAAGLFCVAVPNELTDLLDLDSADLRLESLADLPLSDLLRIAGGNASL